MDDLCRELRPHVGMLVAGLGIPDVLAGRRDHRPAHGHLTGRQNGRVTPDLDGLADRAAGLLRDDGRGRAVLGVVGCPGSGKSTFVDRLVAALTARPDARRDAVAHVPMDGFHLADQALDRLGLRHRKGAPETFDAAGYAALLRRVRTETTATVYAPAFERDLEQPLAGAIAVPPEARLVVTEGNYLLLDGPWAELRGLLSEVWFVQVDDADAGTPPVARHKQFGKSHVGPSLGPHRRPAQRRPGAPTAALADLVVELVEPLAQPLVDVAPAPRLALLEAADDRVPGLVEVPVGMPVRRRVAAADVAAGQAQPEVHPLGAVAQALLAPVGRRSGVTDAGASLRCSHARTRSIRATSSRSTVATLSSIRSSIDSSRSSMADDLPEHLVVDLAEVAHVQHDLALGVQHLLSAAVGRSRSASRRRSAHPAAPTPSPPACGPAPPGAR